MPTQKVLWKRVIALLCALIKLMVAAFSSAIAYWTTGLRRLMKSDLAASDPPARLMATIQMANNVLAAMIMIAIASTIFAILGIYIAIHRTSGIGQCIYGFIAIVTGGYVADHVQGFQSLIATFIDPDDLQYDGITYYGSVGQAAYGALVIILSIALLVIVLYGKSRTAPIGPAG
ncbi:uncharacterized protein N7483_002509 [Penicillium malachiteum]|uniref:uncharacterized protein n=1 Tax=Penicillium malachiteum TaxID=1324776 RepID=UPI00254917AC|nr:uncharacterized protein N7483_002509 [Penicillium malachiteum]KAJ5737384.1 hypothetical protein N7483_002509 [Penicillium malachiteum]